MRILGILSIFFLVGAGQVASAHTTIVSSSIEDGAVMSSVPPTLDLEFGAEVGLAVVELLDGKGEVVPIDFVRPRERGRKFSVSIPPVGSGDYVLRWRAVAKDGHVMKGEIRFTVSN